jgi:hypothetical protein
VPLNPFENEDFKVPTTVSVAATVQALDPEDPNDVIEKYKNGTNGIADNYYLTLLLYLGHVQLLKNSRFKFDSRKKWYNEFSLAGRKKNELPNSLKQISNQIKKGMEEIQGFKESVSILRTHLITLGHDHPEHYLNETPYDENDDTYYLIQTELFKDVDLDWDDYKPVLQPSVFINISNAFSRFQNICMEIKGTNRFKTILKVPEDVLVLIIRIAVFHYQNALQSQGRKFMFSNERMRERTILQGHCQAALKSRIKNL